MLAVAKERNTPDCALAGPRGQWGPGREGKRKGLQGAGGEVTACLSCQGRRRPEGLLGGTGDGGGALRGDRNCIWWWETIVTCQAENPAAAGQRG